MNDRRPHSALHVRQGHMAHPTRLASLPVARAKPALDQVAGVWCEGDRTVLSLTVGPDNPVSRANNTATKEEGLLPRS